MRSIALLMACGALLGGCAVAARMDARGDYQASAAAYKACLAQSPAPSCENQRLTMEVDERKYNNLSAGLNPGSQQSVGVTVLTR